MFEQLDHTPIPEYIPIYHALDWIADVVSRPYEMRYHDLIAKYTSNITSYGMEDNIRHEKDEALFNIGASILTGKVRVYSNPFHFIYRTPVTGEVRNLNIPMYKLNIEKQTFEPTQYQGDDVEVHSYSNIWERLITPVSYSLIKRMMDIKNFSHIDELELDGFILDIFGLSYEWRISPTSYTQDVALLYLKTGEVKKHFIKNNEDNRNSDIFDDLAKEETRGRKQHYSETESLIVYLLKNNIDLSVLEKDNQTNFAYLLENLDLGTSRTLHKHFKNIKKYYDKHK